MNYKGFTLLELLVVIAIVGMIASVVLASMNSARKKSRDARRIADIREIQTALELYFNVYGVYPAGTYISILTTALTPTHIATLPQDPLAGRSYAYQSIDSAGAACSASCVSYVLRAILEQDNLALNSDIDGTVGGIDCADTSFNYCQRL